MLVSKKGHMLMNSKEEYHSGILPSMIMEPGNSRIIVTNNIRDSKRQRGDKPLTIARY